MKETRWEKSQYIIIIIIQVNFKVLGPSENLEGPEFNHILGLSDSISRYAFKDYF